LNKKAANTVVVGYMPKLSTGYKLRNIATIDILVQRQLEKK
jgi:hypothetical protein